MNTTASTLARYRLLTRVLEGRGSIPSALVSACASQGGLAQLSLPAEGITPLALNTIKACADRVLETGGWQQLDGLRRQVQAVAKQRGIVDRRRRPRVQALRDREAELAEALATERRYRIRLERAYSDLLGELRSLAKANPMLAGALERYTIGFSLKRLTVIEGGRDA
jgi:hypothetical protein